MVAPTRIAAETGLAPVEIVACVFGVSSPVPVAILYSEIWLERRSTTNMNLPEGATTMEAGPSPAEKGEPVIGARMPSGALGSLQLVTTWLQIAKPDTVLALATYRKPPFGDIARAEGEVPTDTTGPRVSTPEASTEKVVTVLSY